MAALPVRLGSIPGLGLGILVLASLGSCTSARPGIRYEATADSHPPVEWPRAPEPTRIRLLASVARPEDIGVRKSIFRRFAELLFGSGELRRLRRPYGLAVDREGRLYVADPDAAGIHVFDTEHGRYRFQSKAGGFRFRAPVGVAVDPEGNLYVSDPEQGVVVALDRRGKFRFVLSDGLERPTGIAWHTGRQQLYVVDTRAHRVVIFDATGRKVGGFGGRGIEPGRFNFPTGIAIGPDGTVYLTDSMNFRIQIFTADGDYLRGFGRHGDGVGDLARPKGISVDSDGHVYVVEGLFDVVNVYSPGGVLLLSFGGAGRGPGEFWLAAGLVIDRRDRVYVADSFNGRVQVFQYYSEQR